MSEYNEKQEKNAGPGATAFLKSIYSRTGLVIFILASFHAMGILWHALPATFPLMMVLTPYVLLVFGLFIFASALLEGGRVFLCWAVATYVVTFTLEAIGVAGGNIFGAYYYGDVLGIKLLSVPLVIGFNWTIVVLGIASFISRFVRYRPAVVLLTAVLGVGFDALMEPIAMALGYWHWQGGAVPLQNYLAWFCIGLAAATGYVALRIRVNTIYPGLYVLIQALFFVGLRFVVV
jgi:putative membrane protein